MPKQMRLAIMTGAGGVGKTTLAANLGYEIARLGYRVVILDLDPQGSINVACRLNKTPAPKATTAWLYSGFFDGNYTLVSVWQEHVKTLEVMQGGGALFKVMSNLAQPGGVNLLKEALTDYPLPHDLIIFDCPATLEYIPKSALAAATHLLIPLVPDAKAIDGTRVLLDWYNASIQELHLSEPPPLLGFALNNVENSPEHQRLATELPPRYEARGYRVFPLIPHYDSVPSCWSEGVPLRVYRKTHPGLKRIEVIVDAIVKEMGGTSKRGQTKSS